MVTPDFTDDILHAIWEILVCFKLRPSLRPLIRTIKIVLINVSGAGHTYVICYEYQSLPAIVNDQICDYT